MPQLEWNKATWDGDYDWSQAGDEWSTIWGGADKQWKHVLLPRIGEFVPAEMVLEIAPGFGRWTQYLAPLSQKLVVVDYAEKCIQACQERFKSFTNIEYHVNDGRTLPILRRDSIDFAFSFDSLVHVDWPILDSYLCELAEKLAADGVAFIHHSNLMELFPESGDPQAKDVRWHHRATDVSAALVEKRLLQLGLKAIRQELVNWGTVEMIDCMTTFTRRRSKFARPNEVIRNPHFMADAERIRLS